jgi:hypothetical protein
MVSSEVTWGMQEAVMRRAPAAIQTPSFLSNQVKSVKYNVLGDA